MAAQEDGPRHVRGPTARAGRLASWVCGPFEAFGRHWNLTRELTRRDVLGRYRGSNFGLLWSLLGPLLMLVIYTIAFGHILGSRWNAASGDVAAFGIVLFAGLIVHGFFSEIIIRSPRLMVENANYVKRVVFPLPILSWSVALSALFHMAMNFAVFVLLSAVVYGRFSPYIFLVPVVVAPLVLISVALSWFVAALGVYVRDISQAVPVVVTAMLFLSSAIVPVEAVPERFQIIFVLNPLTFFIDQVREVALWGRLPDWTGIATRGVAGLVAMYAGYAWFRASSKGFADVL